MSTCLDQPLLLPTTLIFHRKLVKVRWVLSYTDKQLGPLGSENKTGIRACSLPSPSALYQVRRRQSHSPQVQVLWGGKCVCVMTTYWTKALGEPTNPSVALKDDGEPPPAPKEVVVCGLLRRMNITELEGCQGGYSSNKQGCTKMRKAGLRLEVLGLDQGMLDHWLFPQLREPSGEYRSAWLISHFLQPFTPWEIPFPNVIISC